MKYDYTGAQEYCLDNDYAISRADGTIPGNQRDILLSIGRWLERYGEAIYGTRPWYRYGEGPRYEAENSDEENDMAYHELRYSADDVRYTTKGDVVYAIFLGKPEGEKTVQLKAFDKETPRPLEVQQVSLLGTGEKIRWDRSEEAGLTITLPAEIYDSLATVLKISTAPG